MKKIKIKNEYSVCQATGHSLLLLLLFCSSTYETKLQYKKHFQKQLNLEYFKSLLMFSICRIGYIGGAYGEGQGAVLSHQKFVKSYKKCN